MDAPSRAEIEATAAYGRATAIAKTILAQESETRTLDQIAIRDWFDAMVTAEDTARHKPEPDVFLEAARRLGVPP